MKLITAPEPIEARLKDKIVFLAGSIEGGKAWKWQKQVAQNLDDLDNLVVLNPYREAWDESWKQEINNPVFREQVDWELDGIECADIVIFYFMPGTTSPISLLELGYVLGRDGYSYKNQEIIVCCPKEFYRKGNVDIICHRTGIRVVENLDEVVSFIRSYVVLHNRIVR
jgi:hypothetical protein